jgi:hypothetical protein
MVVHENAVARTEVYDSRAHFDNFPCWFVAEDQRRFLLHIPTHDIARANTTGAGANQRFSGTNRWHWFVFKADVS